MDIRTILTLAGKLGPMEPEIEEAVGTLQRVLAMPDVQKAIETLKKAAPLIMAAMPPNKV